MKTVIQISLLFALFGIHKIVASETLSSGLVGHWRFDESNGTTAHDSSGNSYDAILYNAGNGNASWVFGKVGGAILLDGNNDYLAIKDLNYSQSGQIPAVSVASWIKTGRSSEGVIISYDRSEYWRLSVGGENDNGKLFFASTDLRGPSNGTSDTYANKTVNSNSWRHVVVTYDATISRKIFYVDGVLDRSVSTHGNRNLGSSKRRFGIIGQNCEDINFNQMESGSRGQIPFQGSLDDLRLYDRALSVEEVRSLFQMNYDSDLDGLSNSEEADLGTNPLLADSDGDGLSDSLEVSKTVTFSQINGSFSFASAQADAQNKGGHLATITSSSENSAVKAIASGNPWLGAKDDEVEGAWKWITGESWNYTNWNSNEPNNSGGNEDGLEFYANTGKWNDITLNNGRPYILEKSTLTEITDPLDPDSNDNGYSDLLDHGLLAWFPFENNASDMSGNNRHGSLFGSPNFSSAIQGKALFLDGVDDHMDIAHDSSLDPRREISISMWLNISSLNKTWTPAFYKGPGPNYPNRSYALWLKQETNSFHAVSADSQGQQAADSNSNSWTTNQWYHTVSVINRNLGHIKFYLDGTLLSSGTVRTTDTVSSSNSLRIGGTQEINSDYQTFNGKIDNLRIYDYAIDGSIVSKLYALESNASNTNGVPYSLNSSSALQILENRAAGTQIGQFTASDPDADSLTYRLTAGLGDGNNSLFVLETNGTLKTGMLFDYETYPNSYGIRVRVTDEHNASTEGNFTILLTNEVEDLDGDGIEDHYDPDDDGDGQTDVLEIRLGLNPRDQYDHANLSLVETLNFEILNDGKFLLQGKLLADGSSAPSEFGFIVTSTNRETLFQMVDAKGNLSSEGVFSLEYDHELKAGTHYVYQAFAINELGIGIGQMKWLKSSPDLTVPEILSNAEEWGAGWFSSSWFGEFMVIEDQQWIFHRQLGWIFPDEDGMDGLWIWSEPEGWLWTKSDIWPFLWSNKTKDWLYLTSIQGNAVFYDYSINSLR